jgi:hypothetical protein
MKVTYKITCWLELKLLEGFQHIFYKLFSFEQTSKGKFLQFLEWFIVHRAMRLDAVVYNLPIENVESFYQELKKTFL